jgi:hypothetical protein
LQGKSARDAFAIAVREDNVVAYEQYLALYGTDPLAASLRAILDRRLMMIAWQEATALNTAAAFAEFLARYPNSDLSATARRLQQRSQNRLAMAAVPGSGNLIRAAATPGGGTCPCSQPGAPNSPNPGSVPPGTRASIPVAPGGPSSPGGPVIPAGPGGPGFVPTGPGPVIVPSGPIVVPVIPVIPPRITDPGRVRDPHYPGGGRPDGHRPPDRTTSTPTHPPKVVDPAPSRTTTPPIRDTRPPKIGKPGRGDVVRVPAHTPRIATPRHTPRIAIPRHGAGVSRIAISRHGGGIRMGGGGGIRMGGGGGIRMGGGGGAHRIGGMGGGHRIGGGGGGFGGRSGGFRLR